LADEFGSSRPVPNTANATSVVVPPLTAPSAAPTASSNPAAIRRPDSSGGGGNRFTVTNLQPHDIPQSTPAPSRQRSANATGSGPSSGSAQQQWPRAEEEKLRFYEQARAQVVKPSETRLCAELRRNDKIIRRLPLSLAVLLLLLLKHLLELLLELRLRLRTKRIGCQLKKKNSDCSNKLRLLLKKLRECPI